MNIYEALHADHEIVKSLMSELVSLGENDEERRTSLIADIRNALIPHSRAEEAVFYNSLRMLDSSKKIAMHGYTEHMAAEGLLRALQVEDKINVTWKATAQKLKEALEHHIREEETEMFAAAHMQFTESEAVAMAEAFETMKPEIKEAGLMKTTIDMVANLMPPRFTDRFRSFDESKHN